MKFILIFIVVSVIYLFVVVKRYNSYAALKKRSTVTRHRMGFVFNLLPGLFILFIMLLMILKSSESQDNYRSSKDEVYLKGPLVMIHLEAENSAQFKSRQQFALDLIDAVQTCDDELNDSVYLYRNEKRATGIYALFYIDGMRYDVTGSFMINNNGMVFRLCEIINYSAYIPTIEGRGEAEITKLSLLSNQRHLSKYVVSESPNLSASDIIEKFENTIQGMIFLHYMNSAQSVLLSTKITNVKKILVYISSVKEIEGSSIFNKQNNLDVYITDGSDESHIQSIVDELKNVGDDATIRLARKELFDVEMIYYIIVIIALMVIFFIIYYLSDKLNYKRGN